MVKKLTILLFTLVVLIGLSAAYLVGGFDAYSRYQQSSLSDQEHCAGQPPVHICVRLPATIFSAFYPSYVAAQYPLFTIIYSSSSPIALVVSVSIVGLSQVQSQTVNAGTAVQSVRFTPPLISQLFRALTAEFPTSLHVQVVDTAGHLYYLNDSPLLLHSRWLMQWDAANRLLIAAWVTPNAAEIATLALKAATHLSIQPPPTPKAMVGYISASTRGVIDQVDALYDTLRLDYGMQYLQASVPYSDSGSDSTATQTIKLPGEVLHQQSGMCIELTLLLASAVEHIGLHAEIVIISGHAFLGVAVTPGDTRFEYWDPVEVQNKVAGDSANIETDGMYAENALRHTIVDTILISDARTAKIDAMLE